MEQNRNRPMRVAIIGAGSRGRAYSEYSKLAKNKLEIVSVVEPDNTRLRNFSEKYAIPEELQFTSSEKFLNIKPPVDTVLIATPDRTHVELATAFAASGYHIILEKPIGIDVDEVNTIEAIVKSNMDRLFGICHVLLYTPLTHVIKTIIQEGDIGDIVSIQHLEPIGYWHYAHSYVRGNWRRDDTSSPLLLAKSCHDIDWIMHIMGEEAEYVSSFGSLNHFSGKLKPAGAADRCIECPLEKTCSYSASRFYRTLMQNGEFKWPLDVVVNEFTQEALEQALRTGPYGRCVYSCDNTVVDNQIVNIHFKNMKSASFSVMAFSDVDFRKTKIFGTKGMIETDGKEVNVFSFQDDSWKKTMVLAEGATAADGHGGGDFGFMEAYISAWQQNDYSRINNRTLDGCTSHKVVFAAERARLQNCVIKTDDLS